MEELKTNTYKAIKRITRQKDKKSSSQRLSSHKSKSVKNGFKEGI